jgi:hypothetical protein
MGECKGGKQSRLTNKGVYSKQRRGMSTYRNDKSNFTIISNAALRDSSISLKAKGMLALMRSYPDDWTFHTKHLETLSTDGREATGNAIRELIEAGYVKRIPKRNLFGRMENTDYLVSDTREFNTQLESDLIRIPQEEENVIPTTNGFPVSGLPVSGKPATKNTDSTKTKDIKTKKEKNPTELKSILDTYNEHRGSLPKATTLNTQRTQLIERLIRETGSNENAQTTIQKATQVCAQNDFYKKNNYGFDTVCRHATQQAERWQPTNQTQQAHKAWQQFTTDVRKGLHHRYANHQERPTYNPNTQQALKQINAHTRIENANEYQIKQLEQEFIQAYEANQ